MAKFYYDATDMTEEELAKLIKDSQRVANLYGTTMKIGTKTGEVRISKNSDDMYFQHVAQIGK